MIEEECVLNGGSGFAGRSRCVIGTGSIIGKESINEGIDRESTIIGKEEKVPIDTSHKHHIMGIGMIDSVLSDNDTIVGGFPCTDSVFCAPSTCLNNRLMWMWMRMLCSGRLSNNCRRGCCKCCCCCR